MKVQQLMKKLEIQCKACQGTGLSTGRAEQKGCALVCEVCEGTGRAVIEYEEFTGRVPVPGIRRIFLKSCGYGHSADDYKDAEGKEVKYSEGGCTYKEWINGTEPKPVKDLYCPYLWSGQAMSVDHKCGCTKHLGTGSDIPKCKQYARKSACWGRSGLG